MHVIYRHNSVYVAALIFLLWITPAAEGMNGSIVCPIGFTSASTKAITLCYRLKTETEPFAEFYKDCANNKFSLKSYNQLDSHLSKMVWTEYRNAYPGGPFLDTRFGETFRTELDSKYTVNIQNRSLLSEEDLCVVVFWVGSIPNYEAVGCDEKHYRFCFVPPITTPGADEARVQEHCKDMKDSLSFASPVATCLSVLSGTTEGRNTGAASIPVRATWLQAQDLCKKNGGASLLNRGWRYANHPRFHDTTKTKTYPLGIIVASDSNLLRFDALGDHAEISPLDWNFKLGTALETPRSQLHGALGCDWEWRFVNTSYVFFDVICERTVKPRNISLHVTVDKENKIVIATDAKVDTEDVYCFTDAVLKFDRKRVRRSDASGSRFTIGPEPEDGYYHCIYADPITKKATQSKALFIREKESLRNVYAVKFRSSKLYTKENYEKLRIKWEKHLKEYIYYTTKYMQYHHKPPDENNTEGVLQNFKSTIGSVEVKDEKVIRKIQTKRTYRDGKTVLYHVDLYPEMRAVPPGSWDSVEVLYMKPVYYCPEVKTERGETVPQTTMDNSVTLGCVTYKCVGDFTEGVQWVETSRAGCVETTQLAEITVDDETTTVVPTLPPRLIHKMAPLRNSSNSSESSEETTDRRPPKTTTPYSDDNTTTTETVITETISTEGVITVTTEGVITVTTEGVITVTTPATETTLAPTEPTPVPPEDKLQEVIQELDRLVNETVSMENITNVFDQVNTILEVEKNLEIPGRLLHLLDQLGSSVELNGLPTAAAVGTNVALLVGDATPDNNIWGLRIATRDSDQFANDSFEILTQMANSTTLNPDINEAVVQLPASVASSTRRVSFVVFRNDRAFRPAHNASTTATRATPAHHASVNSRILSVNVQNLTKFSQGEVIDIHISPINSAISRNESRTCAYWHFTGDDDRTGYWSQDGCAFIRATRPGLLDTCRCDHLTHFAEILVPRGVFSEKNESVLEVISIVGCCLSVFGLTMVAVTAAVFRSWRRDFSNKIWLQLCISILFMSVCFIIIAFAKFDHYDIACMIVGIALHYSVLCSFCWMLVAAVLSYRRLVLVFTREASHKLLRASAFAYGAPCAVVGVLLSVAPQSYSGRFDDKTPSGAFCYPSGLGLWLAVYAPLAAMLLANWTLFALIVRSVFASKRIQRHGDTNEALRCASVSCLLVFLFGLPWIFGLFAYNIGAAYLFTVTATFQGFILFLFFVLGNKKTRDLWLNKLKVKQTRKVPVTSSTYTNRSVGYRGANPPSTMEGKESKPRSLTSSDDSKFS